MTWCMAPSPVLWTAPRVARYLSVTPNTVRRWASNGKLRHVTLPSGQIRFREEDVKAVLADESSAA